MCPLRYLKDALISPALSHVSMEGKPTLADNLRLVNFMAQMLELTDDRQAIPAGSLPVGDDKTPAALPSLSGKFVA